MEFTLVENKKVSGLQPAAMNTADAIKYIGTNREYFRQYVNAGMIPYIVLPLTNYRRFLRSDLDAFLSGCERGTMSGRESAKSLKGIAR